MRQLGSVLFVLLGVGLVLLGLLFLMAAGGRPYRYGVAVVCLALGGALAGLGVRLFKQAQAASPEQLRAEILALARARSGEVSEADLAAALGTRAERARPVLAALEGERRCQRHAREGATYYVFPELQPRLVVRRCEYCQAEVSIAEEATTCPRCGGTIKTQVERKSLSGGDAYSMDEEK
jgi:Zn finger protein HypA/HybF involved in hydrogenase expression